MNGKRIILLRIYAAVFAAATLLVGLLLCGSAVKLYSAGKVPEKLTETGARIAAAFTPETVAASFREVAWSIWIWLGFALAGIFFNLRLPERKAKPESMTPPVQPRGRNAVRIILLVCAAGLIVYGTRNGSAHAMFVKAITICSECIGLG